MTLWHLRHCLGDSGDLAQWAHFGVDEEDEDEGCVEVSVGFVVLVSAAVLGESV